MDDKPDEQPDLDLPEIEEKGFPWAALGIILVIFAIAAAVIVHNKSKNDGGAAALEQQLSQDKKVLAQERDKVFDITRELDAMKLTIAQSKGPEHEQAVQKYNQLAADQREQREKVKALADEYNKKLAEFNAMK